MMTRVLVTGANGHIGANVVRRLLRRGYEVVPFVRRTSDLRGLEGLGLSFVYGDMMDADSLIAAAEGCEVIIHSAAVYRFWAKNADDIIQPAVVGTRNVFSAARQTGVKRIVYTSSTFAVGSSDNPDTLRTADDWNTELHMPYTIAKTRSEQEAWRLADEFGIPMIALCPHGILGPYDYRITPTMALIRDLINGSAPTSTSGVGFVDVRDVADVHAKAVDGGEPGQRYIIAGENMLMKDMGEIIAELTGVRPRHLGAGRRLTYVIASLAELVGNISGSEPFLTRAFVNEIVGRYHYYDCDKTKQTYGFTPRKSEETLADTVRWLLYLGQIKADLAGQMADKFPPDPKWQAWPTATSPAWTT